ncbi:MAG: 16S rRNA (guanine(966)-N(2))-methyltransferase RsmD [Deltaproteobacteria bacterium]|nr:MAG: 16S rRNA (guanine(966)-N(2))-methyltransferase RsmD [Deltaproteobacteria bacterium]
MRITGGTVKGQRLAKVRWPDIRPTADMVRGSIFNIVGQNLSDLLVLDLFAGSGSLGIESLSRGAKRGVFIDNSRRALAIINKNIGMCGFREASIVIKADLPKGLHQVKNYGFEQFDLVFMDPPYESGYVEPTMIKLIEENLLNQDGVIVVERSTGSTDSFPSRIQDLRLRQTKIYGSTSIGFYGFPRHKGE